MEKFGEIRKAVEFHKKTSEDKRSRDDYYRVDRYDAAQYFAIHPKWEKKIRDHFQEMHQRGEEVVYVDICGRATGKELGADRSYSFSLKTSEFRKIIANPDHVLIDGDIFNSGDFSNFIKRLEQDNAAPALVTFEPIVGLQGYNPNRDVPGAPNYKEVTYGQLEKRLADMVAILKPGGYIYLEKPFQGIGLEEFLRRIPQNQWDISLHLKKLARKLKCRIEIASEITGPYFLIHKPPAINKE